MPTRFHDEIRKIWSGAILVQEDQVEGDQSDDGMINDNWSLTMGYQLEKRLTD